MARLIVYFRVIRVDAFEGETRFDYDPDGLLVVRMTNAVGHTRTASYDLRGN
jgi:YD repeat-containing protein